MVKLEPLVGQDNGLPGVSTVTSCELTDTSCLWEVKQEGGGHSETESQGRTAKASRYVRLASIQVPNNLIIIATWSMAGADQQMRIALAHS